jgi:hypothetical protein
MKMTIVKRLVTDGVHIKESHGYTAFLHVVGQGNIPIMHWLLTEGGSSLVEKYLYGAHALLYTARMGRFSATHYLLEKHGALITESDDRGLNVWSALSKNVVLYRRNGRAELSSAQSHGVARGRSKFLYSEIIAGRRRALHEGPGATSTAAVLPGAVAGYGRRALPLACCVAICRRRVRRHHPGRHVGGRAARASAPRQEGRKGN